MLSTGKGRVFYGWRIVVAASGIQFLLSGLWIQSFGAYVAVLRDSEGWSKTALSGAAALQQVESALLGPVQGWIADRFGPREMIRIGVVLFGLGLMGLSATRSLPAFYAANVVIAIGMSLAGYFSLTIAIVNWFERYRSRALSMMGFGLAMGGFAAPVVAWSLQTYGWRPTAFGSGVLAIAIGLPLAGVVRRRPEDQGERVDGAAPSATPVEEVVRGGTLASGRDFTAAEAVRTPAFWLVSLGHASALLVVGAVNVHAITHLKEGLGYTVAQAALMLSVQTAAQMAGIVTGGAVGDSYNKRIICAACMWGHMTGLLMLTYAISLPMVIAAGVLHGFAWGMRGPFMQAIRADHFGRSAIGTILGLSLLVVLVGQAGGPLLAGYLADHTGNYRVRFTVLALIAGLGSVFFLLAKPPRRP